jgi:Na+-transporting methylmalonyl-CoA/oxaloacetate decarboxylase gamma subunit
MVIATVHSFVDSLEHLIGFGVVLIALTALWGVTAGIGAIAGPRRTATAPAGAPAKAAPAGGTQGIPEEEVAAIAATVAVLMGRRSRVVSIRSVAQDWSREGRRDHFASHRIR